MAEQKKRLPRTGIIRPVIPNSDAGQDSGRRKTVEQPLPVSATGVLPMVVPELPDESASGDDDSPDRE